MKLAIPAYVLVACLVSAPAASGQAVPTEPPAPTRIDITKVSCRDLLNSNPLDRAAVVMFYWGYAAGQSGVTSFRTGLLRTATEHLMKVCRQQPSATMMSAMRAVDIKAF